MKIFNIDNKIFESPDEDIKSTLERAVEEGVNLNHANLYKANLIGANLYEANLNGVYLIGANLEGANLYGANLDGARGIKK